MSHALYAEIASDIQTAMMTLPKELRAPFQTIIDNLLRTEIAEEAGTDLAVIPNFKPLAREMNGLPAVAFTIMGGDPFYLVGWFAHIDVVRPILQELSLKLKGQEVTEHRVLLVANTVRDRLKALLESGSPMVAFVPPAQSAL